MPVSQNIRLESLAMVADPIFVEDDLVIAGIHHAIGANLVFSHHYYLVNQIREIF